MVRYLEAFRQGRLGKLRRDKEAVEVEEGKRIRKGILKKRRRLKGKN